MAMVESSSEDRSWAAGVHLASLSGHVIPLGNVIGPLIVWLIRRERSSFVDQHGKEAINFQLSVLLYSALLIVIGFYGFFRSLPWLDSTHKSGETLGSLGVIPLAAGLFVLLWLGWFVEVILGAVAAANGKMFRYFGCIRFIS